MDIVPYASSSLNSEIVSGSYAALLSKKIEFKDSESSETSSTNLNNLKSKYTFLTAEMSPTNALNSNGTGKWVNKSPVKQLVNGVHRNDSDEIPQPKVIIDADVPVVLEWKKSNKIGAGLVNLGNTCFMNSVLQCLTYCPPLVNHLIYSNDAHKSQCKHPFCVACTLAAHIERAFGNSGSVIKPVIFAQRLKTIAKHFQLGRQEDAHEYLRYVLDHMCKARLNSYEQSHGIKLDGPSKETTVFNKMFGGYHRSRVDCFECKHGSNTYDFFMDFMLDIKNVSTLERALDKFVSPEILNQDNAYKCPRCKKKVHASKQFTVYRAPNVATFQLKRFDFARQFGGKITKHIQFPEHLNLRPYMSEKQGPPIVYKLNSVLVHLGPSCNSGHYYCYVRNSNNMWHLMDDTRVNSVGLNHVLQQQAYILFYVRKSNAEELGFIKKPQTPATFNKLLPPSSPVVPLSKSLIKLPNGNSHVSPSSTTAKLSLSLVPRPLNVLVRPAETKKIGPMPLENGHSNQKKPSLVPYESDSGSSDEEISEPGKVKLVNGSLGKIVEPPKTPIRTATNGSSSINIFSNRAIVSPSPKPLPVAILPQARKPDNEVRVPTPIRPSSAQAEPLPSPEVHTNGVGGRSTPLKATSTWSIQDQAHNSPSLASGSSTNSFNSTTDWNITEPFSDSGSGPCAPKRFRVPSALAKKIIPIMPSVDKPSAPLPRESVPLTGSRSRKGSPSGFEGASRNLTSSAGDLEKLDQRLSNGDLLRRKSESLKSRSSSSDRTESKKESKKKKKAKKAKRKEEKQKRKSKDSRRSSASSDSGEEIEWVEKTKETLTGCPPVLEKKWSDGVADLASKPTKEPREEIKPRSAIPPSNFEVPGTSLAAFGSKVQSWNGNGNSLDKVVYEERYLHNKQDRDDRYNEEFDRGKVKKVREHRDDGRDNFGKQNPFQTFQSSRHSNSHHHNHHRHHPYRGDYHRDGSNHRNDKWHNVNRDRSSSWRNDK